MTLNGPNMEERQNQRSQMIKSEMQLLHINVMAHFHPSHRPTAGLECSVGELRLLSQGLTLQ